METTDAIGNVYRPVEDVVCILGFYPSSEDSDDLFAEVEDPKDDDDAVGDRSGRANEEDASFALPYLSSTNTSDLTTPSSIEGYSVSCAQKPAPEDDDAYIGSQSLFSSSASSSSSSSPPRSADIGDNYEIESFTSSSSSSSSSSPSSSGSRVATGTGVRIKSEIGSVNSGSPRRRGRRRSPARGGKDRSQTNGSHSGGNSTVGWRDRSRSAIAANNGFPEDELRRQITGRRRHRKNTSPARGQYDRRRELKREGPKSARSGSRRDAPHLRLTSRPFGLPSLDHTATQRSYCAKVIGDAEREGRELLARIHTDLKSGFPRAELWLPSTAEARGSDRSSSNYIPKPSWEELMTGGPSLKKLLETQRRQVLAVSAGLREAALRSETLLESLSSADETLSWLKMHKRVGMTALPTDPILCTSKAILDNVKSKVAPVMMCHRLKRPSRSIDDMLRRASPYDMTDPISFLLIMLARLSRACQQRRSCKQACDVMGEVDPLGALNEYSPGDCSVGILKYLTGHARSCGDPICMSYIAGIIVRPDEFRGKYFTCV